MAGVSMNKSDPNGWTWVFGKNKKHHTKPIDNPFVKDVERTAASFFVMNFPDSFDAKGLWKECEPYGRTMGAFIASKHLKLGSYHVYVSVARFQRLSKTETNVENTRVSEDKHVPHTEHVRPTMSTSGLYVPCQPIVKEVDLIDDLVSNDSGDRRDVEECRSLNDEEDPNNKVCKSLLGMGWLQTCFEELRLVPPILNVFYIPSGLEININKSNLDGVGISSSEVDRMAGGIGCVVGSFPFSYLGLPIGWNMGCIVKWKELFDHF
ncbi:hypothetical protein Tco_0755820 [Tanacetum coccineum]